MMNSATALKKNTIGESVLLAWKRMERTYKWL